MLIRHKGKMTLGLLMTVVFVVVLGLMFSPIFKGQNAFEAADGLFNSISKASTDRFEELAAMVKEAKDQDAAQELTLSESIGPDSATVLNAAGAQATYADGKLTVKGDLKPLLVRMIQDSEAMYENKGDVLQQAYGMDPKRAMFAWWSYAHAANKEFKLAKKLGAAKILEEVKTKALEVGYNYYGVDPTPASSRVWLLTFALVFYVVYTMWWGFSIFNIFDGVGLQMTKSSKTEV